MKIIELYTKLANNEIIPRYIKVCERKYEFDESDNEYYPRNENDNDTLLERISRGNVWAWLNTEVQELNSLEEEKKIPERVLNAEVFDVPKLNNMELSNIALTNKEDIKIIKDTLNKVLDYLKSKGE